MTIKLFKLGFGLKNPFRIAHGVSTRRESVFLRIEEDGAFGMGEAPIVPYYGLSAEEIEADIRRGLDQERIESDLGSGSYLARGFSHPVSAAAYQSALLSLRGRLLGLAPASLLGLGGRTCPPTSFTVAHHEDPEEMLRVARDSGFRRLKVKVGMEGDIERVRLLRENLPDAILRLDANQGWSLGEAERKLTELEGLGIELVEEPVRGGPADYQRLASGTSLPILLDESLRDLETARRFAEEAPAIGGIVVKTAKNGGPLASVKLAEFAAERGIGVMLSCMVETSLGLSSAVNLAPLCTWCDLDGPLLIEEDPFVGLRYEDETPRIEGGWVEPGASLAAYIEGLPALRID